jgi:hypothetical protein
VIWVAGAAIWIAFNVLIILFFMGADIDDD